MRFHLEDHVVVVVKSDHARVVLEHAHAEILGPRAASNLLRRGEDRLLEHVLESPLARLREARIIDVIRDGERIEAPLEQLRFVAGDQLLLETPVAGVKGIKEMPGVLFQSEAELGVATTAEREALLMEGILGSRSTFLGKTLRDLNFRKQYGVHILAVHRQGENLREHFEDVKLDFGDTLLVQGPADGIHRLMQERDFLSLTEPTQRAFRRHKAPLAIMALGSVIVLGAFHVLPLAALALIAAIFVVVTRCLDIEEARGAVEWRILYMILGMLALGTAMETTGAAHLIASGLTRAVGHFGPAVTLSVTYLVATLLTELISNNAVAVLLTPIAFEIAATMGVDARPFAVAVMEEIGVELRHLFLSSGGEKYARFDAELRFNLADYTVEESSECISGLILQGEKKPHDCPAFGLRCTPENPMGAPMVSTEGACAAYYQYRRNVARAKEPAHA